MNKKENYEAKSTFDLAFGLATNQFHEDDKMIILSIIKERTDGGSSTSSEAGNQKVKIRTFKVGSKAEKINKLFQDGKTPKQIFDLLNKKKPNSVYYPEIYRVTGKKSS